tara:strand:- start:348 stop:644 length:297 start_codon:yes stop_codon:yes gene_type:complete
MKKIFSKIILINFIVLFVISCSTHTHVVGNGPQIGQTETKRQWYIAFGLAPINEVDTKDMAGGSSDYKITTQTTFVDGLITAFTGNLTVSCRTVKVEK